MKMLGALVLTLGLLHLSAMAHGVKKAMYATHVDRMELNEYDWVCGSVSRQVIIWQWTDSDMRYEAVQFYFLSESGNLDPFMIPGGRWRFNHHYADGRIKTYETSELIITRTMSDPWKVEAQRRAVHK